MFALQCLGNTSLLLHHFQDPKSCGHLDQTRHVGMFGEVREVGETTDIVSADPSWQYWYHGAHAFPVILEPTFFFKRIIIYFQLWRINDVAAEAQDMNNLERTVGQS